MKFLQLTKNTMTKIYNKDYYRFGHLKWYCTSGGYAARRIGYKKKKIFYLHRLIMNAPIHLQVDHINGNKLDNRRYNLRLVLPVYNNRNHKKNKHNKSGWNGVYQCEKTGKWIAQYSLNNKTVYIGKFKKLVDAIKARTKVDNHFQFIIR